MDNDWIDAVALELDKLGRPLASLPLTTDRIHFILHDVYMDGAPAFVAALSLVEAAMQL